MPLKFSFTDRKTNSLVTLDKIDLLCCEMSGEKYSDSNFCMSYQVLTMVGMAMMVKFGKEVSVLTEEIFNKYMEAYPDALNPEHVQSAKNLLVNDYQFECWYNR